MHREREINARSGIPCDNFINRVSYATSPPARKTQSPPWSFLLSRYIVAPRRVLTVVCLAVVLGLAWLVPTHQAASAAGPATGAVSGSVGAGLRNLQVSGDTGAYPTSCIGGAETSCYASVSPAVAFAPIGTNHTASFLCNGAASALTGSSGESQLPGCFDLRMTAQDLTTGSAVNILSATCGKAAAAMLDGSSTCGSVSNPICAPGTSNASVPGTCVPVCPPASTYEPADGLCHVAPSGVPPACPAATTAVNNSSGVPIDCTISPLPSSDNAVTVTINPGAAHVFRIDFSGYLRTTAQGTCPAGTTYTANVQYSPTSRPAFTASACAFTVSAETKYLEGTTLTLTPTSPCGGGIPEGFASLMGGAPCFFSVQATGMVVLKTGVDCSNSGEPANGSAAPGFSTGSVYGCLDGALAVSHVPMPGVKIHLHAVDGYFEPTCIPNSRVVPPSSGTVTPTASATAVPTATNTPVPVTVTATPPPSNTSGGAFCGPPGHADAEVVTDSNGVAGAFGQFVQFTAQPQPPVTTAQGDETIVGQFLVDQAGIADIPMYVTFHFAFGDVPCDSGVTDATGTASCTRNVGIQLPGSTVPVNVSFLYNCTEYDTATSFAVGPITTPTATVGPTTTPVPQPAPPGICVVRSGYGQLTVDASYTPVVNSQPALSTGPVVLGEYGIATATPVATATPAATPAASPTVVPTSTVIPTPTGTVTSPTPTATSAPTVVASATATPPLPTPTSTPVVLSFSLDAARVAQSNNPGNRQGLDTVNGGQRVRLMMYYTIRSLPKAEIRVTTYDIRDESGTSVFRVSFKGTEKPGDTGRFIRYTYYSVPANLPFGRYDFRATLRIAGRSQTREWRFAIVQGTRALKVTRSVSLHDHVTGRY